MIAELHAVADTTFAPTHTDPIELSKAMQGLHIRDMLGYDDYGVDEDGVDNIDITRMDPTRTMTTTLGDQNIYRPFMPSLLSFMTFLVTQ